MNNLIYLQLISLNKKHTKHYLRRYVKLISFYKQRNWSKQFGLHEHHILPESFGGPDTNENLVFITIREHFILHWMLYKAFPQSGMVNAFFMMCNGCKHYYGNKVTSKVYQNTMLEFIERQSETARENNRKRIEEGTHPFLDKEKQSQRAKKRVEDGTNHWLKENQIKIECEHCKKIVDEANYNRWHGNKCKLNPLYIDERKIQPKIECPHCNQYFSKDKFIQWHGDKCKLNPLFIDERKPKPKIECPYCNKEFNKGNYLHYHGDKCKLKPQI